MRLAATSKTGFKSFILIMLGGLVNIPFMLYILYTVFPSLLLLIRIPVLLPSNLIVLSIIYFFLGIIYCTSATLLSRPKRIISPIYTQFVSFALIYLIIVVRMHEMGISGNLFLFNASITLVIVLSLSSAFGLAQTPLLRFLVGLKGNRDDLNLKSFVVNARIDSLSTLFQQFEVAKALNIRDSKKLDSGIMYEVDSTQDRVKKIIILKDPDNEERTQVAIAQYKVGYFAIERLNEDEANATLRPLELALQHAGYEVFEDSKATLAEEILSRESLGAIAPALVSWGSLQGYKKTVLISLSAIILILFMMWYFVQISVVYLFLLLSLFGSSLLLFFIQFGLKKRFD